MSTTLGGATERKTHPFQEAVSADRLSAKRTMRWQIAVKWGVVLGAAVCIWTLCVHFLGWYTADLRNGKRADRAAIVLPLVVLYLAIRERARQIGREPTLIEAMSTGVLAGLFSVPITAGFLWVYHHFINPAWLDLLVAYERERLSRSSASPEAIQRAVARLLSSGTDRAQLFGTLIGTIGISIIISLLAWAALRLRSIRRPRGENATDHPHPE